ncbi:MAG: VacJ family lipoprotein [Thiovulaceae bacterium]|nr:VacJ family lipoprotein [Sulfurimonadaceae bacterium]
MKIVFTFLLIFSLNLFGGDFVDNGFEDEFEKELVSKPSAKEVFDPLVHYNRFMTDVNDMLMINVVEPVTDGYRYVVPQVARKSIYNLFENLYYPVSVTNNLLQLKFNYSFTETIRFLANSTLGILGLFDVADEWFGIKPHKEDFGQTLGYYGVGSGFPIVMPFFGQYNIRDFFGNITDNYFNPTYHASLKINDAMVSYTVYTIVRGYKEVNEYSLSDTSYEDITKGSFDLYPFIRDAYEQNRNKLIEE